LQARQDYYKETGETLNVYACIKLLPQLKQELPWLQEVNSQALQCSLGNLEVAYTKFFKGQTKYPKFKAKGSYQSFCIPQFFSLSGNKLYIPKFKKNNALRIKVHKPLEGKPLYVHISKTPTNKYFATITCELELAEPQFEGATIGIDLGIKSFAVTSEGESIEHPHFLLKDERKLAQAQRRLSKKQKGSKNRDKAKLRVAQIHERIANRRKDFLHKTSKRLVDENQVIYLEDLSVKHMLEQGLHSLAKRIQDSGWSEFRRQLTYKGDWRGCYVTAIDPFAPSSKRCSVCGAINRELTLADRTWTCANCLTLHDRDQNASQNILYFGRAGTARTDKLVEQDASPALKQEADLAAS
jgi:putative transposase